MHSVIEMLSKLRDFMQLAAVRGRQHHQILNSLDNGAQNPMKKYVSIRMIVLKSSPITLIV